MYMVNIPKASICIVCALGITIHLFCTAVNHIRAFKCWTFRLTAMTFRTLLLNAPNESSAPKTSSSVARLIESCMMFAIQTGGYLERIATTVYLYFFEHFLDKYSSRCVGGRSIDELTKTSAKLWAISAQAHKHSARARTLHDVHVPPRRNSHLSSLSDSRVM